ncbi:hypothetical protein FACS1894137_12230 [Spirochaetia bacterium]|nr:hypothetical protein FACS1894137_12230 [Spirochaetia bacterium]
MVVNKDAQVQNATLSATLSCKMVLYVVQLRKYYTNVMYCVLYAGHYIIQVNAALAKTAV